MAPSTHVRQPLPTSGHPELITAIRHEIAAAGAVPFAQFMELALYHPQFGYYMRSADPGHRAGPDTAGEDRIGEDRIGWNGDYYTTSDVSGFLATALARQAREVDERLGEPETFTVIEMGPGKGLLARDFLRACEAECPYLFSRLRYVLIERSPAMRAAQAYHLAPWTATGRTGPSRAAYARGGGHTPVVWLDALSDVPDRSVTGLLLSNELVDALPVHRIRIVNGHPQEVYVRLDGDRFAEELRPAGADLTGYLTYLAGQEIVLPDGATADINLAALSWMRDVARVVERAVVVTIDYGHTAHDLYDSGRRGGTLLCYYHQTASDDPYSRIGLQDMTAHVDFTALATVGEDAGLSVTGFTNQMSFLMSWGIEQELARHEPGSREFQSLVHVLRPDGMGRTFKLLVQHRGFEPGELTGLKLRPFFGTALSRRKRVNE